MSCYIFDMKGGGTGFICGDLGPHCADCMRASEALCDFPVGNEKTCDRQMCEKHSAEVAPDIHYCPSHLAEWQAFRDAGGVAEHLRNIVAFKAPAKQDPTP